jgi:hypothetical protein
MSFQVKIEKDGKAHIGRCSVEDGTVTGHCSLMAGSRVKPPC